MLLQLVDAVLERRLTVLQAPGGFGKTTVLADVSRRKKDGVLVAWLSLHQDDTPDVFGFYLARAFEHAGLDLAALNHDDAWSSSPCKQRLGMLARAVELHAAPCLLVLDELELLPRATVESVDLLLKHSPSNLHFAIAFRFNPGLDLALHVLGGTAVVVKTEQFRFSRPDIVRFFDGALTRREVRAVAKRTAGWPVAVMVARNTRVISGEPFEADATALAENFVEHLPQDRRLPASRGYPLRGGQGNPVMTRHRSRSSRHQGVNAMFGLYDWRASGEPRRVRYPRSEVCASSMRAPDSMLRMP